MSPQIVSVPLNDLSRGIERDRLDLILAAEEVLDSGYLIHGPKHSEFEEALAKYLGIDHAIGVASGTDALELAIKALMPEGKSTVLTAANAGSYTATAALRGGFSVIWADVDSDSLCVTVDTISEALTSDVGVVVSTHIYGNLTDQSQLVSFCHSKGIRVVEDCAQAIGARRGTRSAGTWGDIGAISFYPTKNLGALGDGGAVITKDAELAATVRQLSQYGWGAKYHVDLSGGVNSRLDELQAAMLLIRLPLLDGFNLRRRSIVARYVKATSLLDPQLINVMPATGEHHVAHLAVARSGQRDYVRTELGNRGIKTDIHFPIPDYAQVGLMSQQFRPLPVTEQASKTVFSLPCFPEMTEDEVDYVCSALGDLK